MFTLTDIQKTTLNDLKKYIPALREGQFKNEGGDILLGDILKGALFLENLQAPDLSDDDRFLISVVMQATPYTLDETTLPADNPPRNVIITHTTDTTTDTLGDAIVRGTDVNDEPIEEIITIAADGVAVGVLAFKTVTFFQTPGWVIGGGVADLIEVGFGNLLGLSSRLAATSQVALSVLGTAIIAAPTVTVDPDTVSRNTVNLSGGTYDGSKLAKVLVSL